MDYALDFYFENINTNYIVVYPQFIYNDHRILTKFYIIFKFISLIFYIITLSTCNIHEFYIFMIFFMFLATINSARYEYKLYKRYGTIFNSEQDFELWKKEQWSKSRLVFSFIEFIIKIIFYIEKYPPLFTFNNFCEIGESIYKIHIIILFLTYIFIGIISICLMSSIYILSLKSNLYKNINISYTIQLLKNNEHNEECCICMDLNNIQSWSVLPCGHKFHNLCISQWLRNNISCPVCRHNIRVRV